MIAQNLVNTDHTLSSKLKNSKAQRLFTWQFPYDTKTENLWTMFQEKCWFAATWVGSLISESFCPKFESRKARCDILCVDRSPDPAWFFESHLILKSLNTVTLSCIIGDAISIVRYEESPSWTSPNERLHAPIQFSLVFSPPAARPRSGAALVWPGTELLASSGFSV